jgi:DNA-damage-inducible protein J
MFICYKSAKNVNQNIDIRFTFWYALSERGDFMTQTMVNFRIDDEIKKGMERACKDMGLSLTAAFTIFATKVSKERRIPFDITADPDPFYLNANMERLKKAIADANAGRNMMEHELIEVDDD